jgi:hypothetical protein
MTITLTREEAQQVIKALGYWNRGIDEEAIHECVTAIETLRAQLAQPEPEPVAWMTYESEHRLRSGGNHRGAVPVHQKSSREAKIPLYTAPQLRSKDA